MSDDRPNTTDYVHPEENNLRNIHKAMEYNSIGQPILRTTGSNTEWAINISNGSTPGVTYVEKFGMNVDVDANKETVWDGGGIYTYVDSATHLSATSSSSDDAAGGTGARTVNIQGLDASYNLINETITLGGQDTTTLSFLRVFRAQVTTVGSEGINVGTISILADDSSTVLAQIGLDGTGSNAAGRGQTFMSIYTIPAGKTGYLTQWTVGAGKQNTDAVAFLMTRVFDPSDGAWNSKDVITVSATTYAKDYKIPLMFPEKSDIEVRAYSTTNNAIVSSTFNILLIDN